MEGEELRRKVRRLLVPGGERVGTAGRRPDIRVMRGGVEAAREFLGRFKELGEVQQIPGYPGELIILGADEARVGLRTSSKSGEPTIDVTVKYVPEIRKIKFV